MLSFRIRMKRLHFWGFSKQIAPSPSRLQGWFHAHTAPTGSRRVYHMVELLPISLFRGRWIKPLLKTRQICLKIQRKRLPRSWFHPRLVSLSGRCGPAAAMQTFVAELQGAVLTAVGALPPTSGGTIRVVTADFARQISYYSHWIVPRLFCITYSPITLTFF